MTTKKKKKKNGAWFEIIDRAVGYFIHIETKEGLRREGKLSGLRKCEMIVNGELVDIPIAIEFNGDPNDNIDLRSIAIMDIDWPKDEEKE